MSTLNDLGLDKNLYKITEKPAIVSDETQSESIISGELLGDIFMVDGFLRSKDFVSGVSGWTINADGTAQLNGLTLTGGTLNYAKTSFTDSTNAGYYISDLGIYIGSASDTTKLKYTLATGAFDFIGTITGSTIVGGTINVPDVDNPLFSVDSAGNVEVESLKRRDFNWVTIFESIDGYLTGGDTLPFVDSNGLRIRTAATNGSISEASKECAYAGFSWNKKRRISFVLEMSVLTGKTQKMWFGTGTIGYIAGLYGFGFYIDDEDIYAYTGNGTSTTYFKVGSYSELGSGDLGGVLKLDIEYNPGVNCIFIFNNDLLTTITTNLPSGTADAGVLFSAAVVTLENVLKTLTFKMLDFWQSL
jgi:hypothetical protein